MHRYTRIRRVPLPPHRSRAEGGGDVGQPPPQQKPQPPPQQKPQPALRAAFLAVRLAVRRTLSASSLSLSLSLGVGTAVDAGDTYSCAYMNSILTLLALMVLTCLASNKKNNNPKPR